MSYVQEYGKNYFVVEEIGKTHYIQEMFQCNEIEGFLSVEYRRVNHNTVIYYDVSGWQELAKITERRSLSQNGLIKFLDALIEIYKNAEEYLLPVEGVSLSPKTIYTKMDYSKFAWIYLEEENGWSLAQLFEFLMERIDYEEENGIKLFYSFYQLVKNGGGIKELEQKKKEWIEKEKSENKEIIKEENTSFVTRLLEKCFKVIHPKIEEDKKEEEYEKYQESNTQASDLQEEKTMLLGGSMAKECYILKPVEKRNGQLEILIEEFPFYIGKLEEEADGIISDSSISRVHAKLDKEEEVFFLTDMNSTNGTFLNGERLVPYEETQIIEGDKITFAKIEYDFCKMEGFMIK